MDDLTISLPTAHPSIRGRLTTLQQVGVLVRLADTVERCTDRIPFVQFFLGIGAFIAGWVGYATTETSWVS
jgi:hypothetical protein